MSVRHYIDSDLKEINRWEALHGADLTPIEALPQVGFIYPGVCAGFLLQTDSAVCFLDGFTANPEVEKEKRRLALDSVTEKLLITAKDLGFKSVLAFTSNESIKARCNRYEFSPKGEYNLFVRRF
jgi:hypothetical protein